MRNPFTTLAKFVVTHIQGKRSPKWPEVQKAHIAKEGFCKYCGGTKNLQVHHIQPFHLHPELELDENNLITLCEEMSKECHLKEGHLGNFKNYNPDIRKIAIMKGPKE